MKRISSLLLAIVMLLSLTAGLSISAYAEKSYQSGDYQYRLLEDGTAEIYTYAGVEKELIIPSELDGYTVKGIGNKLYLENRDSLISVKIPDGVTYIGDDAFSECVNLTSIEIPEGVTNIGDGAFAYCIKLQNIEIPESVINIGSFAFEQCYSLTNVEIPENVTQIGEGVFDACEKLKEINVSPNNDAYSSIDGVLFNKDKTEIVQYPACHEGDTYLIPDSVTSIGSFAFADNTNLKSIDIPDNITELGFRSFFHCYNLENVTIGQGVSVIEEHAFDYCTNLKTVSVSKSVTEIKEFAFDCCESLESIYIYNKNCNIASPPIPMYTIPESATIYGYEGSTAQAYADEFGIKFVAIEEETEEPTTEEATTQEPATEEQVTQEPTTEATTQKPTTETTTKKPTTEKTTAKSSTEASAADKKDTSKSPDTGAAEKGLYAIVAIALACGAVTFVKKKEQ